MPTQRTRTLSNGQVMLGGFDYATSEACQWFLDGASDAGGFAPCELKPTREMHQTWARWVEVCRTVWADRVHATNGHAPEMPDGFPIDAMHTAQGAGVGVDDGDRDYSEGLESECAAMADVFRTCQSYGAPTPVREAFRAFEHATQNAIPETHRTGDVLHPEDRAYVLRAYVHRSTPERNAPREGCPLQFASDADWLANTTFKVRKNGRLDRRVKSCESRPTWPHNPELRHGGKS